MSVCIACGQYLTSNAQLCSYHSSTYSDNWAESNRVWCDFFHRGRPMPRLPAQQREDDWPVAADM